MKNKLLLAAVVCLALVALVRSFGKTVLAQVRATLTQNVDEPGRNAFAFYQSNASDEPYYAQFKVPAGKRYVVEQYKATCDVVTTSYMTDVQAISTVGGDTSSADAPTHFIQANGSFNGNPVNLYGGTGLGPVYGDPGTTITVYASAAAAPGSAIESCDFYISGHSITL